MKVIVILSLLTIAAATKIRTLRSDAEIIPGSYLITLKDDVNPDNFIAKHVSIRRNNGEVVELKDSITHVWEATIKGFAAKLDDSELSQLDADPEVEAIEPDQIVRIAATVVQNNADWGIARHSSVAAISSPYTYRYDDTAGSGARVYVVDTGIRTTHNQFGGRAIWGTSFITGETNTDLNGHGTHCAGTVGGTTYGVAKLATLIAVKVLNSAGSGTLAGVISGIDWVTSNRPTNVFNVISLSLGSSSSATVNAAAARARTAGIFVAAAAGNSNANACNYSPAGEPSIFTIGSTANNDARSSFSNFGTCVDIFAGGTSITSAYHSSDTATAVLSGTSMACPQVAGLAAYTAVRQGTTAVATVESLLLSRAASGRITNVGTGSPNLLSNNELAA